MDSTMKERPILFNAAMVNAILAGNKTQTRREIKPQPYIDSSGNFCWNGSNFGQSDSGVPCSHTLASPIPSSKTNRVYCPLGKVGDQLWVREAWATDDSLDNKPPSNFSAWPVRYLADGKKKSCGAFAGNTAGKNRPSMHMPRWACRITLEITAVRVERLKDISEHDAKAEGVIPNEVRQFWLYGASVEDRAAIYKDAAVNPFYELWQSIYGTESWGANPWVWIIEFKRITP